MGSGLSLLSNALEFLAEVLKVFPADLQFQHFFDRRREVSQREYRTQRSGGGPNDSPRRSQDERVLDRFQWQTAFVR
jgi:hypothetical protein